MRARYYTMLALTFLATIAVANLDINLWMVPFLCFGVYTLCLRCPKCGRWTMARDGYHIAWVPKKCDKCGYIYD